MVLSLRDPARSRARTVSRRTPSKKLLPRHAMTTRSALLSSAALLSIAVLTSAAQGAAGAGDEQASGHARMLAELKKIIDRTDGENELLGSSKITKLKEGLAKLKPDAPVSHRFQILVELGDRMVYYRDEKEGLGVFRQAFELGSEGIPLAIYQEAKVRHAAAWMLLAETENCCANNNKDSCILPFRDGAIHTKTEGS